MKYEGLPNGLIKKYDLPLFSHTDSKPLIFIENLFDKRNDLEKELNFLVSEEKILNEQIGDIENNLTKCFPIEKNYYHNKRVEFITKREAILSKEKDLAYLINGNKDKLEKEKKYLQYPVFEKLETLAMMSPAKLTNSTEFFRINEDNSLNKTDYFRYLVNFSLPEFAIYPLNSPTSYLILKFGITSTNGKNENRINPDKIDLISADLPTFYKKFINFKNQKKFLRVGDYQTKSCEFISKFNNHFNKKESEKIKSARKNFEENIYVLSKANWMKKTNDLDDFLVLGYSPLTERAYLIFESKN